VVAEDVEEVSGNLTTGMSNKDQYHVLRSWFSWLAAMGEQEEGRGPETELRNAWISVDPEQAASLPSFFSTSRSLKPHVSESLSLGTSGSGSANPTVQDLEGPKKGVSLNAF
jgi:hypothetical protein